MTIFRQYSGSSKYYTTAVRIFKSTEVRHLRKLLPEDGGLQEITSSPILDERVFIADYPDAPEKWKVQLLMRSPEAVEGRKTLVRTELAWDKVVPASDEEDGGDDHDGGARGGNGDGTTIRQVCESIREFIVGVVKKQPRGVAVVMGVKPWTREVLVKCFLEVDWRTERVLRRDGYEGFSIQNPVGAVKEEEIEVLIEDPVGLGRVEGVNYDVGMEAVGFVGSGEMEEVVRQLGEVRVGDKDVEMSDLDMKEASSDIGRSSS